MNCRSLIVALGFCLGLPLLAARPARAEDHVLFDFEDPRQIDAWSNLELPDKKPTEPPAKLELLPSQQAGSSSLKITFAGGNWPTITTTQVPGDWMPWETFQADVVATRPCLVGFTVLQEGSSRGMGWDAGVSRWTKTEFLKAGKNTVTAMLHPANGGPIGPKVGTKALGPVVRFEFFMYQPHEGEIIYLDNIRLTAEKQTVTPAKTEFRVLGTDLVVSGVQELSKKLEEKWVKPEPLTIEAAEAEFRALYDDLKRKHPRAVLAILRDGEKGYDPADKQKVFAGWQDAYWSSHGPDGLNIERATNRGRAAQEEMFMRHRSPLHRVDLSSIPAGSNILAAQLMIVRAAQLEATRMPTQPNMWVVEPCNRPWVENEVNAYQYAKDKFWKAYGGMSWGDDPDFLPLYLAYGPGREGVTWLDFTAAVRFWTDGQHANHGFMLHGDSRDWYRAWYREAAEIKNRPAVLVIYEPNEANR